MKPTSYAAPHYASLLQPPATSTLLGPYILLSTLTQKKLIM